MRIRIGPRAPSVTIQRDAAEASGIHKNHAEFVRLRQFKAKDIGRRMDVEHGPLTSFRGHLRKASNDAVGNVDLKDAGFELRPANATVYVRLHGEICHGDW